MFRASLCPSSRSARPYITAYGFQHCKRCHNKVFALWPIVCCVRWWLVASIKCAVGCVLCGVRWFVFLLWQVKVLSWEGAWCGGVLEMCVPWLEVASYVWLNVCSEWLQVVNGWVLSGGMYICGSVSEGGGFRIKLYIFWCAGWCLGKLGSRPCALCRACYSTSFIIKGREGSMVSHIISY